MNAWRVVRATARKSLGLIVGGLSAIIVLEILSLYAPLLIKQAVDQLARGEASAASLLRLAGALALLAVVVTALRMLGRPLMLAFGRRVERDLRDNLARRLLGKTQSFFDGQTSGQIMARATYDLNNLRLAAGYGLQAALDSALPLVLALACMLWLSPWLTLLAGLPMLAIPWLTRRQSILFHSCHQNIQSSFSALSEEAGDCLGAIRLVKVYNLAQAKRDGYRELAEQHQTHNLDLARASALYLPVMTLVTHISQAVVWGAGGALVVLGSISPGDIVAFSTYLAMMQTPLVYSGYLINLYQRSRSSAARLQDIFQGEELKPVAIERQPAQVPEVVIRDLRFTYPGEKRPVLAGIDLTLPSAGQAALVGPVGSGKSTLLGLLAGLYQPPLGSIMIQGQDLSELPEGELRCMVGLVPQEPFIFSASVRENLTLAKPGADEVDLWRVLSLAGLDQEIKDLSQGLETELGEQGLILSGGQRARLALARALLPDPPILLLDDPLSAVDPMAEARILRRLADSRQGRTTLIVSHRPGALDFAQTIVVLDQGRLAAQGRHRELLATSPLYRRLLQKEELSRRVEGAGG